MTWSESYEECLIESHEECLIESHEESSIESHEECSNYAEWLLCWVTIWCTRNIDEKTLKIYLFSSMFSSISSAQLYRRCSWEFSIKLIDIFFSCARWERFWCTFSWSISLSTYSSLLNPSLSSLFSSKLDFSSSSTTSLSLRIDRALTLSCTSSWLLNSSLSSLFSSKLDFSSSSTTSLLLRIDRALILNCTFSNDENSFEVTIVLLNREDRE